jgi:hypothetical protein
MDINVPVTNPNAISHFHIYNSRIPILMLCNERKYFNIRLSFSVPRLIALSSFTDVIKELNIALTLLNRNSLLSFFIQAHNILWTFQSIL